MTKRLGAHESCQDEILRIDFEETIIEAIETEAILNPMQNTVCSGLNKMSVK